MSNELSIKIGADGKQADKAIGDLRSGLKSFQNQVTSFKNVGLGSALASIKPGADRATQALTNTGRIIQDLPFGFIGIQNNLNPLLESFGRLKSETGSGTAALKAMAGSLVGPAGLGIALSAVSSLIVYGIQKYGSLGNALNEVFGGLNNVQKANIALAKSFAEAEGSSAGEISKLQALVSIAQDESRSRTARIQAMRSLNETYKDILPNLDLENIKTQQVAVAIDKLTESLVRQAKIKGVQNLIEKETAAQAELLSKGLSDNANWYDEILISIKNFGNIGGAAYDRAIAGAKQLGKETQKSTEFVTRLKGILKTLLGEEAEGGTLSVKPIKSTNAGKTLEQIFFKVNEQAGKGWQDLIEFSEKEADKYFDDLAKQISSQENKQKILDAFNGTNEAFRKGIVGIKPFGPIDPFGGLEISQKASIADITRQLTEMGQKARDVSFVSDPGAKLFLLKEQLAAVVKQMNDVKQLSKDMANAVSNVLAPAFSQFFDALVSGSQNFGEAFKNMLKSILSQIVATIAQAAILSAIFSAFGLGGGSAGGFMGLFKSFLGIGAKPMAAGGLVTAPTYALVGEAGPEAVIPLDRMNELMAGRLEVADTYIRGEDIVQIWKVVSSRNQRKF
jgi:hypothetical protein